MHWLVQFYSQLCCKCQSRLQEQYFELERKEWELKENEILAERVGELLREARQENEGGDLDSDKAL